ncbi:hypothetical protein ACOMHN_065021 [Nucella lapillus]
MGGMEGGTVAVECCIDCVWVQCRHQQNGGLSKLGGGGGGGEGGRADTLSPSSSSNTGGGRHEPDIDLEDDDDFSDLDSVTSSPPPPNDSHHDRDSGSGHEEEPRGFKSVVSLAGNGSSICSPPTLFPPLAGLMCIRGVNLINEVATVDGSPLASDIKRCSPPRKSCQRSGEGNYFARPGSPNDLGRDALGLASALWCGVVYFRFSLFKLLIAESGSTTRGHNWAVTDR